MFKEFVDGAGRKTLVQSELVFVVNETPQATAVIVAPGGAAVQTTIPYAEVKAWLEGLDREAEEAYQASIGLQPLPQDEIETQ